MCKVVALGDIHGDFQILNALIREEKPDIVLQVGDFGFWPHRDGWPPTDPPLALGDTRVFWCEGNHEDHKELDKFRTGHEVARNCYYQPRGSTITLPDGRAVLFFGGAYSTVKTRRQDWQPEERLTETDLTLIPDSQVDIIISHTAPARFQIRKEPPPGYAKEPWLAKFEERTPQLLNRLWDTVKPKEWYFGHYHIHQVGYDHGVKWTALAAPFEGGDRWWIEL